MKHFRFTPKGKRRIHQTPGPEHLRACRPWLEAEFAVLKPEVVVCLGATAAKALISPSFRITKDRGQLLPWTPPGQPAVVDDGHQEADDDEPDEGAPAQTWMLATTHPSAILRAPDEGRPAAYDALVADLDRASPAPAGLDLGGAVRLRPRRTPEQPERRDDERDDGHRHDDDHAAGHHRDADPGRTRDRPGPEVAQPRAAGDDDDEHALHPAAHLVGRGQLQHRGAQHRADHVAGPGDREAEDGQPQGRRQPEADDRDRPRRRSRRARPRPAGRPATPSPTSGP